MSIRILYAGGDLLLGFAGTHESCQLLPESVGCKSRRQEQLQRGMADCLGGVCESPAGCRRKVETVFAEVSGFGKRRRCSVLAGKIFRTRRECGTGAGVF